ncbi:TetR/AcrR family transcriptional regulator [Streptomyces varsoviensis]|uniref:TetR family transcriptional regulator n=1 Tax=Streptomyces varsoviensis TaxID=67373 RepID=A0ABR5IWU4_9ACTN|nr:TetR/AcrR family transcriptional regulator [Streptomyces varsoviensis]KOG85436.1 TetR family transcriptional regulator [Streptomyces varsoviensis]
MTSGPRRLQPRKQPKQVRAELTRQRILTAAAEVFADYGYAAGTTNRIAERAGISIGSLYQYYPNKDAVLAELTAAHLDAGLALVRSHQDGELPESLEDILRLFVRAAISDHRGHPQLHRVLFEQAPRTPQIFEIMYEYEAASVDFIKGLLERHPEVKVEDKQTAARLVVTSAGLLVHQLVAEPNPIDVDRFENELVAMLTRYLTGGGS